MQLTILSLIIAVSMVMMVVSGEAGAEDKNPVVLMETSVGNVKIELDQKNAPISVNNFLSYVDDKFYDGTIFHRVISNFMIQGGGFTSDLQQKQTETQIKNEAGNGLKNKRGTIAMARTMEVDSATAQFFINVVDNDFLDHSDDSPRGYGYAVFGKIVEGMDVIDKIKSVRTYSKMGFSDVPMEAVVIKSVKIEQGAPPRMTMKTLDEISPMSSQKLPDAQRFHLVLDNMAVLDEETGLIWEKSPGKVKTWRRALDYCTGKIVGHRTGWRLPTVEELNSLVDTSSFSRYPPKLPSGHPFIVQSSLDQSYALFGASEWSFYAGDKFFVVIDDKTSNGWVWCVIGEGLLFKKAQ